MKYRPLQHPLKAERRLGFPFSVTGWDERCGRFDVVVQLSAEFFDVTTDLLQYIEGDLVVQQCQQ